MTSAKIKDATITGSDISPSADLSVRKGTFSGSVTTGALTSSSGTFSGAVSTGALSSSTGIFSDDITAQGDINQSRTKYGAIKAQVFMDGDGDCSNPLVWTFNNSAVSCSKEDTGEYIITFGFNVSDRLPQITVIGDNPRYATVSTGITNTQYNVYTFDESGTANDENVIFHLF